MAKSAGVPDLPVPPPPWRVKVHPAFDQTCVAAAVERMYEVARFVHQVGLLASAAELTVAQRRSLGQTLDMVEIKAAGEVYYLMTLDAEAPMPGTHAFCWVDRAGCTIWLVDAAPATAAFRLLQGSVHRRVARRIREIKGSIQDGTR